MIELIVLNYLTGQLEVPVYPEYPEDIPERFVIIQKTGGGKRNHLKTAMLAIQSIGPTLYDAAALNEQVKEAMDGLISEPEVTRCELNSDYNYTNTGTKQYRYQAVFDIVHY